MHAGAGTSSYNCPDGRGTDVQEAHRPRRKEIPEACSLPEEYQYSSLKKTQIHASYGHLRLPVSNYDLHSGHHPLLSIGMTDV